MNGLFYLLRFFRVVSPLSSLVVWTFGVLVLGASAMIVAAPERTAGALAPLLLLQMFAASSGFAVPARRGYYDLLLTATGGRTAIALTHWLMSISPGLASWFIVASVEALRSGHPSIALASGTCAAMAIVSTIPWAVTIALPRFSGGIGWLLVLTTAAFAGSPGDLNWLSVQAGPSPAASWAFLVYPVIAVGKKLTIAEAMGVAPALVTAATSMVIACAWIRRTTLPLEAAQ